MWKSKSTARLAQELTDKGMPVSDRTVSLLLQQNNFSMQANVKRFEVGTATPEERNRQFEHINNTVRSFQEEGNPVISVDTKKKELLGNFKNNGREYRKVHVHHLIKQKINRHKLETGLRPLPNKKYVNKKYQLTIGKKGPRKTAFDTNRYESGIKAGRGDGRS